jgi:cellulose synthase/poly-beta-1,6-N-acetylglucosamine synthase-like glycosyltransferase
MEFLLPFISLCYFITFFFIVFGFLKESSDLNYSGYQDLRISVIIAARNEEKNLPKLLVDLKAQTYSEGLFDIFIVDDHSDQRISSLPGIRKLELKNLEIIELPESVYGKKAALLLAAEKSKSELLLFTDADCRVGRDWVMSFAKKYYRNKPALILGMVKYTGESGFFRSFFRQEFMSLIISGIGTANLGFPTLCNGANMAVMRELYLEIMNNFTIRNPSGDDIFLLHEAKKSRAKIAALKEQDSLVTTAIPSTLSEFFNQRARWASKAIFYKDFATIYITVLVTITNLIFYLCLAEIIVKGLLIIYLIPVVLKIIADYIVIVVGLKYFQNMHSVIWLPLFQLIYPIYLIISIILGSLKIYHWKGRKY